MVIREQLTKTIAKLREYGCDNAVFEAHQIMRFVLKLSATDLVIQHQCSLSIEQEAEINTLTDRRTAGEPLQYILGTQEFMSLEFLVDRSVLIPRADTETLVEFVLDKMSAKGFMLLDLCTGTGCIPLSIAHYNSRAYVRGIDISDKALEIAEKNCKRLELSNRACFEKLDILTEIPCGQYDVITANPPYIEHDIIDSLQTEVKDFEPHLALDGGIDGLKFYRRICAVAPALLTGAGILVLEVGENQADAVSEMLKPHFSDIEIKTDLCGIERVVAAKKSC
ncbi:MAG: peptide chain release factor N(5)-glutamine methyltransferase [Clostridiales bacterium]|nr:peptide chain release factor N(5)-glutamine methyltransferase [Clostridiales bacterium]